MTLVLDVDRFLLEVSNAKRGRSTGSRYVYGKLVPGSYMC